MGLDKIAGKAQVGVADRGASKSDLAAELPIVLAVTDYVEASIVDSCLRAIARLKVPDVIADAAPVLEDVAIQCGAHTPALKRVLRLLEAHDFVQLNDDRVRLTARGRLLRTDVTPSLWMLFASPGYSDADHYLEHTLRTGEPAFVRAKGMEFWDYLRASEADAQIFDENMQKQGELLNLTVLPQVQIADSKIVVDVGGGNGSLLRSVLEAHPNTKGILFDRQDVIKRALASAEDSAVGKRCSLVAGDLKGPIPAGDCYILARVLHNWSDADSKVILSAIRKAAQPAATLNILEMVIPPGRERHISKYSDITMLGLFRGGRERTEHEFAELLRQTGWVLEKTARPAIDAIPTRVLIARPA